MQQLQRYSAIVDDPEAFLRCADEPLPRAVWVNTLRAPADDAAAWIRERCPEAEPLPWLPATWRVPPGTAAGKWPEFALGLLHTQEEVALWPVMALDPQPGEAVLDMCAAPGNKTAQIAVAMGDRGYILANEISRKRLESLQNNIARMGLSSVAVSHGSGTEIRGEGRFDRVLVDAPCTCEGTTRKRPGRQASSTEDDWHKMAALQKGLLRRAVALTRPGGSVVYSTCTYAPEENEGVLSGVDPEQAVIEPLRGAFAERGDAGITAWEGSEFRRDVVHAARFWPHHNDTGGFFVARLRRL